jgi:LmbE family N-acetylglucosaminyl deacetylase
MMKRNSLRTWLIQGFRRVLIGRSREMTADMLQRPAIFFSPHQDDETLGCGGTIIRKIAAGADVRVVYMTDGHQSHKHLMAPERLSEIRRCEALAACSVLGVVESNVIFLDFPDGSLFGHLDSAVGRVRELLENSAALDLFLPYSGEPTDDHKVTHAVLKKALETQNRTYNVYEYPVWFWHHWPWVSLFQADVHNRWFVMKNTLKALFGLALLRFRSRVSVTAVCEQKSAALNEHKSQMTQLINSPAWLTLHDVSTGEFLNNSLQDYELFYHYVYQPVEAAR